MHAAADHLENLAAGTLPRQPPLPVSRQLDLIIFDHFCGFYDPCWGKYGGIKDIVAIGSRAVLFGQGMASARACCWSCGAGSSTPSPSRCRHFGFGLAKNIFGVVCFNDPLSSIIDEKAIRVLTEPSHLQPGTKRFEDEKRDAET